MNIKHNIIIIIKKYIKIMRAHNAHNRVFRRGALTVVGGLATSRGGWGGGGGNEEVGMVAAV